MDKEKESDVKQDAFDFVDLVFTGKNETKKQHNNLVKLAKKLKNNKVALTYIKLDIKSLIYDTINGDNEDLKDSLNKCYESLYWNHNEDDLPRYLKELKECIPPDIENSDIEKLYSIIVDTFLKCYGKIDERNITWQIDDLYQKIENSGKDLEIDIKKSIYPDFITILGIFTAITFAIFGGMNLLSNLFQNIGTSPVSLGHSLILAVIFGLIMWGIIELLFYWISKIKGITYSTKDKNKKWFNLFVMGVLAVILILGILLFTKIIK